MNTKRGKYAEWISKDGLVKLEAWARDGLTDEQIAHNMGIATGTLYEWKKKYSEINEALKTGKEVVDIKVENALYNKALGYKVDLKKTFKTRHVIYDSSTGKKIEEHERLETGFDEVYVPPDTTAQIFWLKNRKPDIWRDRKELGVDGKIETNNPFEGLSTEELKKLTGLKGE